MIEIVNVGSLTRDKLGTHNYEVRIKGQVLGVFQHQRRDGLQRCLELAAEAVQIRQRREAWELVEKLRKEQTDAGIINF
jgi:hypothetical protein